VRFRHDALEKYPGISVTRNPFEIYKIEDTGWIETSVRAITYDADLSVAFFIKTPDIAYGVGPNYVVTVGNLYDGTANTNTLFSCFVNQTGNLVIQHDTGTNVATLVTTSYTFINNQEYQVIVTRDATAKEYKVYVEGSLVDTLSYVNNPNTGGTPQQVVQLLCDKNNNLNTFDEYIFGVGSISIIPQYVLSLFEVQDLYALATIN
jgi:hypothetical protein